ncbi:MAG: hypothetical protein QW726_06200 [Fervidicoccaceae archaeon]
MKIKNLLLEIAVFTISGITAMYLFNTLGIALAILLATFVGGIGFVFWLTKPLKFDSSPQYRWDVVIMFSIGFVCLTVAFIFSTMTPSEFKDILVTLFAFLAGVISSKVVGQ